MLQNVGWNGFIGRPVRVFAVNQHDIDIVITRSPHLYSMSIASNATALLWCLFHCHQCTDQLMAVQAELQDSIKEVMKSRKKYQEAETMAQAVREKADMDAR